MQESQSSNHRLFLAGALPIRRDIVLDNANAPCISVFDGFRARFRKLFASAQWRISNCKRIFANNAYLARYGNWILKRKEKGERVGGREARKKG